MAIIKNILITGATGYIGKNLVKRLIKNKNTKIKLLIRKNSNLNYFKDFENKLSFHYFDSTYNSIEELFKTVNFDYVFHLASISSYDYKSSDISDIIDTNIKLGNFLLEAMKKYGCKYFINTSTYWQNYNNLNDKPICLYASTKKAFEDIIDFYCIDKKIKAVSLKLYDVYGYDDHRNKLINSLILSNDSSKPTELTKGEQKLYLIYIDDVIDAYEKAMKIVKYKEIDHKIYEIYGGVKYSLGEIIKIIEKIKKKKLNVKFGAKEYYKFQIMNPKGANKLPRWSCKTSLKEGLKNILDYIG